MSKQLEKKVKSLSKAVSQIKNEREEHELNIMHYNVFTNQTNVPNSRLLTPIIEGVDYDNRVGRQITMKSIRVAFKLRGPSGVAGTNADPVPYRIILYQDMGYDGTTRAPTDILEDYSATAGVYNNYLSHYNDDYVRTDKTNQHNPVKILKDIKGSIIQRFSGYGDCWKDINFTVRRLHKVSFSGALSTDSRAGSIFLLIFMGTASLATDNNAYCLMTSTRFIDD